MEKFKEPYYLVEFTSSLCNFEICVNDVPAFNHNLGGGISSHIPINHYILESGKQKLKITILTPNESENLDKDAFLNVKVICYDASINNYENLNTILTYDYPDMSIQEYPMISLNLDFEVIVPYKIEGWKNSIEINPESSNEEFSNFMREIHSMYELEDVNSLYEIQKTKFQEIDEALYLVEDNFASLKKLFSNLRNENFIIQKFPSILKFNFYANNKLIKVTDIHGKDIIYYQNNKNEEFSLSFYLHKKNNLVGVIR